MKKNLKNIILILLITLLNQKSYSKPLPPGSGEGDVPANILILLDSSISMRRALPGATIMGDIVGIQYDDSGNIYATQHSINGGVIRFTSDGEIDNTFNNNAGSWTGKNSETCTVFTESGTFSSNISMRTVVKKPTELRMGQNVTDMTGTTMSEILFIRSEDQRDAVIGIDPSTGSCKYFIQLEEITVLRNLEVKEINNK